MSSIDAARELVDPTDHALAVELAQRSADLLLRLRASGIEDPAELRQEGDRRSHELLVAALAVQRPQDGLLSEEGADSTRRLAVRRVWIVDPLDGTREFGEPGRVDWAVHVALVVDGHPVVGAVALPALGEVWSTASTTVPAVAREGVPPRLAVSRTRPGWSAGVVEQALSAELVPLGSAGFKALAVVRGQAEIYAHSGGQFEWDSAAPVAVALAHGVHASRLDGSPMVYNNPDPYLPDLLIAQPSWAGPALAALAAAEPPPDAPDRR